MTLCFFLRSIKKCDKNETCVKCIALPTGKKFFRIFLEWAFLEKNCNPSCSGCQWKIPGGRVKVVGFPGRNTKNWGKVDFLTCYINILFSFRSSCTNSHFDDQVVTTWRRKHDSQMLIYWQQQQLSTNQQNNVLQREHTPYWGSYWRRNQCYKRYLHLTECIQNGCWILWMQNLKYEFHKEFE